MNEFEIRDITVKDYFDARQLMYEERCTVWDQYECGEFQNNRLGELIEAYDFVIDTLTWLAMELDKKNKGDDFKLLMKMN